MSGDKLVFDLSQEIEGAPNVFIKKDWLNIQDINNANYNSNQSIVDTSSLSNSNKWLSYREGYLSIPLLLTLVNTTPADYALFAPATAATSADYSIGLKNWFGSILHSISLEYNGVTIIQQTAYCSMYNTYNLLTSLSWNDVWTSGSTIGFYPDTPLTVLFNKDVSTLSGDGVCNNANLGGFTAVSGQFNQYDLGLGNVGFLKRQQYINFDSDAVSGDGTYGTDFLSSSSAAQIWKSYISTKQNGINNVQPGVFQISVQACVYLKHMHSFYQNIPLLKGAYQKLTMNLNNCSSTFTKGAATLTLNTVSNSVGGVNPVMVASAVAGNGSATLGNTTYTVNVSVGNRCLEPSINSLTGVTTGGVANSVYLNLPAYSFNPIFEQSYLSSPIKQIDYTDIYQYQIKGIQANTGQINSLITNGIAGIDKIVIVPFYSDAIANNGTGIPSYQSCFDPAGCGTVSPFISLTNFNIVVSGQNALYNTSRYSSTIFNEQVYPDNKVNAGMIDGVTSGLFDRIGWDSSYGYYVVDLSRSLPVEQAVPKSIQVIGQNLSRQDIDLFCFVSYKVTVSVDALTGIRV